MKLCVIEDCEKPAKKRYNHCSMHRARIQRHGSPDGMARTNPDHRTPLGPKRRRGRAPTSVAPRFWAKVDLSNPDGCWPWLAATNNRGYGTFYLSADQRHAYAHRVAYELVVAPVLPGFELDHLCHRRECVNPGHLRLATHRLNAQNKSGPPVNNRSGFLGVYFETKTRKWVAQVKHRGTVVYSKRFDDKLDAAAAAAEARNRYFTFNTLDRV